MSGTKVVKDEQPNILDRGYGNVVNCISIKCFVKLGLLTKA